MRIIIPNLPPKDAGPNARVHYMKLANVKRNMKDWLPSIKKELQGFDENLVEVVRPEDLPKNVKIVPLIWVHTIADERSAGTSPGTVEGSTISWERTGIWREPPC